MSIFGFNLQLLAKFIAGNSIGNALFLWYWNFFYVHASELPQNNYKNLHFGVFVNAYPKIRSNAKKSQNGIQISVLSINFRKWDHLSDGQAFFGWYPCPRAFLLRCWDRNEHVFSSLKCRMKTYFAIKTKDSEDFNVHHNFKWKTCRRN